MSGAGRRRPRGLTPVAEDYLKVVHNAEEWSDAPVTTSVLAERLGVGAPTVSETLRRLAARGWVEHERYGAVTLTEEGRRLALQVVRRHRLVETWLVVGLGYTWDEVHEEAEVLEHAVSDRFLERIDARLGRPARDPHGDPIPTADGHVPALDAVPLADLAPGERGVVVRVHDGDPAVLRECEAAGVHLDAVVTAPVPVSAAAVRAVRVRALGPATGS